MAGLGIAGSCHSSESQHIYFIVLFFLTVDNMPSPLAQCIPERSQEGTIDSPTMHHKRKIRDGQ